MMVRELAECNLHLRSLKSYPELQVGIGGFLKWGIPKTIGHIRFQYSNLNLDHLGVPRFQEPHELIIFKIILLEVGILLVSIWFLAGSGKIFCPARTCQEKTPECPGRSSGGAVQIPCPQTNGRTIDVNKFPLSFHIDTLSWTVFSLNSVHLYIAMNLPMHRRTVTSGKEWNKLCPHLSCFNKTRIDVGFIWLYHVIFNIE